MRTSELLFSFVIKGLYPESHGIVYNTMVDEDIAHLFSISKPIAKDPRWWKGEPVRKIFYLL